MKKRMFALLLLFVLVLTGCGVLGKPEPVESEWKLTQADALTLAGGTTLDLWQQDLFSRNSYRLKDGTEILKEELPSGPENVYVAGRESIHDLPEAAQAAISAYYEERGLLYDLTAEAEKAYNAYLACERSERDFSARLVEQSTSLSASNDDVVYFLTSMTLPLNDQMGMSYQLGDAFDRATGEFIPMWELFAVSKEEVRAAIARSFWPEDGAEQREVEEKLLAEFLVFQPDSLNVQFPPGVLSTQTYSTIAGIDYEDLVGILHDWAVPDPMKS